MNEFRTSDLATAAYLLCHVSLTFRGTAPKDARARYFLFSPGDLAERLAFEFVSFKGSIVPRTYADAMRHAKDLVFADLRRLATEPNGDYV